MLVLCMLSLSWLTGTVNGAEPLLMKYVSPALFLSALKKVYYRKLKYECAFSPDTFLVVTRCPVSV